jgi:membrane protein DedA with SNARE-associated domain
MAGFETIIINWLTEVAHHPGLLYFAVISLLFASSFGLPFPEELVLITCGMIAYISLGEEKLAVSEPTVNIWTLASVCFFAVILSDLLVFWLGKRFGVGFFAAWPSEEDSDC